MKDDPAFPFVWNDAENVTWVENGLTKREYFAGLAMQGIASNPGDSGVSNNAECAQLSVEMADALIAELDK